MHVDNAIRYVSTSILHRLGGGTTVDAVVVSSVGHVLRKRHSKIPTALQLASLVRMCLHRILSFGYTRPVRVCQTCYALLDDLVSQTEIRERPPGESDDSEFEDLSVEVAQTFGIQDASQQQ